MTKSLTGFVFVARLDKVHFDAFAATAVVANEIEKASAVLTASGTKQWNEQKKKSHSC